VIVFGGGIIPDEDVEALRGTGLAGVFTPGTALGDIVGWLEEALDAREQGRPPPAPPT